MQKHIKRLKRHRNVLYGVVVVLLILQVVAFVSFSSKASEIITEQESMKIDLNTYIDQVRQENRANVDEIVKIIGDQNLLIMQQKNDFETQIDLLKASQEDFSGIIEDVITEVVSIRTEKSTGSGFIVDPQGYVITNSHVVQGGRFVQVRFFDGRVFDAQVVGADEFTDVALLKINGFFDSLKLADSDDVQIGEKVIAIGNPLGLSFSVTEGIVSAVEREGPNGLKAYVQTDVSLNPGNSGGPLINKEGEVIGINNFKIGGAESLGFALESDVIKDTVNVIANKTIID
jgi:S1-C subfamily serine protease